MMKKKILVASFDLAIGGVERSLIGLLEHLDYDRYDVDLLLYKHEGELFSLIPEGPNLLPESAQYSTFRKSIKQTLMSGQIALTGTRLLGKCLAEIHGRWRNEKEPGYLNIQYGWALSKPFLQKTEAEYDAAISFLWPHYVVTDKVKAKKKLGWIHTDYSNIAVNTSVDGRMWNKLDHIVAVSEECQSSFLNLFPSIRHKTTVIENIFSPSFIKTNAEHDVHDEMGAHPQRIKLMTVGRLTYAKGLDDAVKACKKLVDLGYDLEW